MVDVSGDSLQSYSLKRDGCKLFKAANEGFHLCVPTFVGNSIGGLLELSGGLMGSLQSNF